jgi:hypothetical protein
MDTGNYYVFGVGSGADDLQYIGWTEKSPGQEPQQIYSDLAGSGRDDVARWVTQALDSGAIDIFEIETARSAEDARESAQFWGDYYRWLGLDVKAVLS